MDLQPYSCTLFAHDYSENCVTEEDTIEIPMEDNWYLFILVNDVEALNSYSDAADEIQGVDFQSTADIPLKILMKVRSHLMSNSFKSSEDKAMDKFISYISSTVSNLNYNITTNYISSGFQSIHDFYKWINRSIFEGIYRSIQNVFSVVVNLRMVSEQKTCPIFVYGLSEIDSDIDLFTIEVPADDCKFPLVVKYDKAFYSDSFESRDKAEIPIKILIKVRNKLISYNNVDITTLEDMALNQCIDTIKNLNYKIPIECDFFESIYCFRKWINIILRREICIYNDRNV